MLFILGGLPGSGKTTIGKALAISRSAVYVRVDEIEHALSRPMNEEVGSAGYLAAYAIAASNLKLGADVVADSVNPVQESREGWRSVAKSAGVMFAEIEVVCSDPLEHRRRVETRAADISGFTLPSWQSVEAQVYSPWSSDRLVLDTAKIRPGQAIAQVEAYLASRRRHRTE